MPEQNPLPFPEPPARPDNAGTPATPVDAPDRFVINIAKRNDSRLGPTYDRYDAAAEHAFEQLVRLVGETEALRLLQD